MNRRIEDENWQAVYSDAPECVKRAADRALRSIRARRRHTRIAAIAACAAFAIIAATVLVVNMDVPDRIMAAPEDMIVLTAESTVFASNADPKFHIDRSCGESLVELPLITALEFDKAICPKCGARVVIGK